MKVLSQQSQLSGTQSTIDNATAVRLYNETAESKECHLHDSNGVGIGTITIGSTKVEYIQKKPDEYLTGSIGIKCSKIAYSPMMQYASWLEGCGGGASNWDPAYSGFFSNSASPLDFQNNTFDDANLPWSPGENAGDINNAHNSLDAFFDHSQSKIWASFDTASYYTWNNGGSNYSGNGSFYTIDGVQQSITGHSSSFLAGSGRGLTIAYLGDNTPVIVIGNTNLGIYYFNYPDGTYIGKLNCNLGGNNPSGSGSAGLAGLCYDGTYLLAATQDENYVYGYDMPSNIAAINDGNVSATRRWSITYPCYYGMAWSGDGVYIGNENEKSKVSYYRLTGTGMTGTSTLVRDYELTENDGMGWNPVNNFSVAIDYKNRKLIIGGFSNNKVRVFSE